MAETDITVEQALAELKEMFPDAAFISAKSHAVYYRSEPPPLHPPQANIQIDDKGFRRETLSECIAIARERKEKHQ